MRDARDGLGFVLFGNTQLTPRYSWRDLAQGTPLWLCDQRLPRETPCFGLQFMTIVTHKRLKKEVL